MSNKISYTDLQKALKKVIDLNWVKTTRNGNQGAVGNTLEDLIGVRENNIPKSDFHQWELKAQQSDLSTLVTLFHKAPQTSNNKSFVTTTLLPNFGWPHKEAGKKYPADEKRISLTININSTYRGFFVRVDRTSKKIFIDFNPEVISNEVSEWIPNRQDIKKEYEEPFWTFDQIQEVLNKKLKNTLYIKAKTKTENHSKYFKYESFQVLMNPSLDNFIQALEAGKIYVDFDSRTHHDHGPKFRIARGAMMGLYATNAVID